MSDFIVLFLILLTIANMVILATFLVLTSKAMRQHANWMHKADEIIRDQVEAWNRTIAICASCQNLLFATDVARTEHHAGDVLQYCQECAEKERKNASV